MAIARNLSRQVNLTIETVATMHPAGTVADHWYWEVLTNDGVMQQQQTQEPSLQLSLPPDGYGVTVQLEDAGNVAIGEKVMTSFLLEGPDVEIQTAGAINVEIV